MLGKLTTSPVFENNGFMKKRSGSVLSYNVVSLPAPGTSGSVLKHVLHCSAILFWLLYPSGHSSAEALSACFWQCLVPGLKVVCFN